MTRVAILPEVTLFALLMLLPCAHAQNVTITFDPPSAPPAGTALSNEYQLQGVLFGIGPTGPGYSTGFVVNEGSRAYSGNNVVFIEASQCRNDVRSNRIWGHFEQLTDIVKIFVREMQGAPSPITLSGWSADANPATDQPLVQQTQTATPDGWTMLSIFRSQNDIASIEVEGSAEACIAIDDLSYDASSSAKPDFGVTVGDPNGVILPPSNSAVATFVIHRFGSSSGNISFSANLPAGVAGTFNPNPTTGGDGSIVTLSLTAGSIQDSQSTVTVTATPGPTAGSSPRTVNFQLVVARLRSSSSPLTVVDVSPDSSFGEPGGGSDPSGKIMSLTIDPTNDSIIYAASRLAGIWKSTDAAQHWQQSSFGLRNGITQNDRSLAIDVDGQRLLYATQDADGRAQSLGGLWVSLNAAISWQHIDLPSCDNPNINSVIFAGGSPFVTTRCGIFSSNDPTLANGLWQLLPTTPPFDVDGARVYAGFGGTIFACPKVSSKIYRSLSLGKSTSAQPDGWTGAGSPVDLGPGNYCYNLAVAPLPGEFQPSTVVAVHTTTTNLEVSVVNFTTDAIQPLGFSAFAGGGSGIHAVFTVSRKNASPGESRPGFAYDVYAADGLNFFVFDPDNMRWWQFSNVHVDTWSMAFPSSYNPSSLSCEMYAANDGGVYHHQSESLGFVHTCASPSGLASSWVRAESGLHVAYSGTMAGVHQPGHSGPTLYLPTGDDDVWVTTDVTPDGSLPWVPFNSGLGDAGQTFIDPALSSRVVSARNGGNGCNGWAGVTITLAVSSDSSSPLSTNRQMICLNEPNIVAGTQPTNQSTFSQVMTLPLEAPPPQGMYLTVMSPASATGCTNSSTAPDLIVQSTSQQGNASDWSTISNFFGPCQVAAIASSGGIKSPTLYVLTTGGQVWKGTLADNQVAQWTPAVGDVTNGRNLVNGRGLFANPYSPGELYVTDVGAGVIKRSTDGGQHWDKQQVLTDIATNHGEFVFSCDLIVRTNTCPLSGMAFDRNAPNIRVAAMFPGGLAFSRDGGTTWMELDVTNNLPRPCWLGPCNLAWDLVEYPQSVFYDSQPDPKTGATSIYMALFGNSVKRVDGPFSTLQSLSLTVCDTCLSASIGVNLAAGRSATRRMGVQHSKQSRPPLSNGNGSAANQISAVFTDMNATVDLQHGSDGSFRGQLLFDSSKVSQLTFHFVADGKSTPDLSVSPSSAEIGSGTTDFQVVNSCPSEWAALNSLLDQIAVLQGDADDPNTPAQARKAIQAQLRSLNRQLVLAEDKLKGCFAPSAG